MTRFAAALGLLLLAAALAAGCRQAPPVEAPRWSPSVEAPSPSVVDYPLAAATEHHRRAVAISESQNLIRDHLLRLEADRRAVLAGLLRVREQPFMLASEREAMRLFYLGKLDAVKRQILEGEALRDAAGGNVSYEIQRRAIAEERALDVLQGKLPPND